MSSPDPAELFELRKNEIRLITIKTSDRTENLVECSLDHFEIGEQQYAEEYATALEACPAPADDRKESSRTKDHLNHDWISIDTPNDTGETPSVPALRYKWGDYLALSYTWGNHPDTTPILINGQVVNVSQNLEAALKTMRSIFCDKPGWKIWIDALCINQRDVIERASQVKRMREIYDGAWTPIVWLGEASDGSDHVLELARSLAVEGDIPDDVGIFDDIGIWCDLYDFVLRRYWLRAWILQETSLGTANMPVLCGGQIVRWIDLHRLFTLFFKADECINPRCIPALAKVGRSFDPAVWNVFSIVGRISSLQKMKAHGTRRFDLFQLMTLSRLVAATDPRDKVYALLALMDKELSSQVQPDYTASVEQVYTDFARLTIELTGSLEILRHVGFVGSYALPCWVPDWSSANRYGLLADTPHMASGSLISQVAFPRPGCLRCRGYVVDTVDGLGCLWRDEVDVWPSHSIRQGSNHQNAYGNFEGVRNALWRTLVANRDVHRDVLKTDYSSLLAVRAIARTRTGLKDRRLEALVSTHAFSYCAGFLAGNADLLVAGRPFSEYLYETPDISTIDATVLRDALMARDCVNLHRRFLVTRKGYIGMALQITQQNDLVCILYGCSMPMVLRKIGDGYQIVGECYVHGLMDGSAIESFRKEGLTETEFSFEGLNVDLDRTVNHNNYARGWKYTGNV